MKNIGKIALCVPVAVGVWLAAIPYFAIAFVVIDWFANRLGGADYAEAVGYRASAIGVTAGIGFAAYWLLLIACTAVRGHGGTDWISRALALLLVAFLLLVLRNTAWDFLTTITHYSRWGALAALLFASMTKQVLAGE